MNNIDIIIYLYIYINIYKEHELSSRINNLFYYTNIRPVYTSRVMVVGVKISNVYSTIPITIGIIL